MRIMIVEDNAVDRMLLAKIIEKTRLGTVTECADGKVAGEWLIEAAQKNEPYDFVFLDYNVPGLDGISLAAHLRNHSATRELHIIMLTGSSEASVVNRALKAGVSDFVVKPLKQDVIIAKLDAFLKVRAKRNRG